MESPTDLPVYVVHAFIADWRSHLRWSHRNFFDSVDGIYSVVGTEADVDLAQVISVFSWNKHVQTLLEINQVNLKQS
jgi:hypothetical protein